LLVVYRYSGRNTMIERVEHRSGTRRVITLVQTGDGSQAVIQRPPQLQPSFKPSAAYKIYEAAMAPYRRHWAELHSQQNPTEEWFADWLRRIPGRSCNRCAKNFEEILQANPPRYDDFFAWSVEVHNAVNQKLNKPILTLEDAMQIWRSEIIR